MEESPTKYFVTVGTLLKNRAKAQELDLNSKREDVKRKAEELKKSQEIAKKLEADFEHTSKIVLHYSKYLDETVLSSNSSQHPPCEPPVEPEHTQVLPEGKKSDFKESEEITDLEDDLQPTFNLGVLDADEGLDAIHPETMVEPPEEDISDFGVDADDTGRHGFVDSEKIFHSSPDLRVGGSAVDGLNTKYNSEKLDYYFVSRGLIANPFLRYKAFVLSGVKNQELEWHLELQMLKFAQHGEVEKDGVENDGIAALFAGFGSNGMRMKRMDDKKKFKAKTERRKKQMWNEKETNALREGAQRFGLGKWKLILESYPAVLGNRTAVDLKDKWRNIEIFSDGPSSSKASISGVKRNPFA